MKATLVESGFLQVEWRDDTPDSIDWARKPVESGGSGRLSDAFEALLGQDYRERIENVRRDRCYINAEEFQIEPPWRIAHYHCGSGFFAGTGCVRVPDTARTISLGS